jgi:hypothetical protein
MTIPTPAAAPTHPDRRRPADGTGAPAPQAGPPLAAPAAAPTAILLAALIVGLGVLAGRDVLILTGVLGGTAWLTPALSTVGAVHRDTGWLLPAAIGLAVIGLILLIVAVKPRRHTHRRLTHDGLWMRTSDVSALVTAIATAVPGVDAAHGSGSARRQRLRITPNVSAATDLPALRDDVDTAVTTALRVLADPPTLSTTLRKAPRS